MPARLLGLWVLWSLGLFTPGLAGAQDILGEMRQVQRTVGIHDGLPQTTAYDLEVDARGWLWVVTQNGVAYNNGRRWRTLPELGRAMRYGFRLGRRILADRSGTVWFASEGGGAFRLHVQPGVPPAHWRWEAFTTEDGLLSDTLWCVHEQSDGTLWFASSGGFSIYEEGRWRRLPTPPAYATHVIRAVHERADGSLWLATDQGVLVYAAERWQSVDLPDQLAGRSVFAIHERKDGSLWFGVQGGIAVLEGNRWRVLRAEQGGPARNVVALYEQADGSMWFGTIGGGVGIYTPDGSWRSLDVRNGLPSSDVLSLTPHPDGSLWVGTQQGIAVLNRGAWASLDRTLGLAADNVWTIVERRDGSFWFGTSAGLSVFSEGAWRTLPGPDERGLGSVRAILEARDGTVWVAARHGVYTYRAGRWKLVASQLFVYDMLERSDGSILLGTRQGAYTYARGRLQPFDPDEPLLREPIKALHEGRDGTLWFGVHGRGVLSWHGGTGRLFTQAHGLPGHSVLDVYESPEGLLWFATTDGLALHDGVHWQAFTDTTAVALPDAFTYRIEQDEQGRYYVSTNRGVVRLTQLDADGGAASPLERLRFAREVFGMSDGLPNYEANQNASLRDSRGRIWFGTVGGAAVYDPAGELHPQGGEVVTIERIQVKALPDTLLASWLGQGEQRRLSHRQNDVRFAFTLGAPGRPDQVQYRTQLVGYDAQPSGWTGENDRSYTNLPSGDYVFVVYGRSAAGAVSVPALLAFSIAPAPWATWGAWLLYALLFGLGLAGLVHWQTAKVRRRHAREAAIHRERTSRKAAEMQTALLRSEKQRLIELNQAHEFRRRVLEGTTNAIFALALDGHLTLFNHRMQVITGYAAEALEGRLLASLFEGEAAREVEAMFREVVLRGETVRGVEVALVQPGGAYKYLSLTLSPLLTDEELTGVVGMAEDVTERRELEQFREDMHHMLVHDLRSPLVVMQMLSQQIAEYQDLPPAMAREAVEQIHLMSRQALELVNNMLAVSRLEAGKMPVMPKQVALADAVEQVVASMGPLAEKQQVALHIEVPPDLPDAYADSFLLQRVLTNLLGNALKFTPRAGKVTLRAASEEGRLVVYVSDTGPGVPPEMQQELFHKFVTGDAEGSGTGLGLAFCRLAVSAMQGRIWLAETSSEGSTFAFTLPCCGASAAVAEGHVHEAKA